MNTLREKEGIQTLPLEAWCLGYHLFQHPKAAHLKLIYEVARQRIRVVWDRSPPEEINFKLDRDVCSMMVICPSVSLLHLLSGGNPARS